ncbi:MAG: hypothetical protein GXY58_19090 [Planctomycetaceae bacterium]|nr:hypothetical protein [Planctomycetaceae bacterium]
MKSYATLESTLQVSRAEDFTAETTRTYSGLRRSVFASTEPLPPGQWFWRYGVESDAGPIFGRPRPFAQKNAQKKTV